MEASVAFLSYRGRLFASFQVVCAVATLATFWALFYWPIVLVMLLGYSAFLSLNYFRNPFSEYVVFQIRILQYVIALLALAEGITGLVLMVSWSNGAAYMVAQIISVVAAVATLFVSFVLWVTLNQLRGSMVPAGAPRAMMAVQYPTAAYYEQQPYADRSGLVRSPWNSPSPSVAITYPTAHAPFGSPDGHAYAPQYRNLPGPSMPPRFPLASFDPPRPSFASPPTQSFGPESSIFAERRHPTSAAW